MILLCIEIQKLLIHLSTLIILEKYVVYKWFISVE